MKTYTNPVHTGSSPDPFVLKHAGEYWAYVTGLFADGTCFPILRSSDLLRWEEAGGALEQLPGGHTCYWAPEVAYEGGVFYMYFSVGNEERMQIRVATADSPGGPFVDSGRALTTEEFAIDPHVFEDADGTRWMFYATDFLAHTHVGTGTVRDRLVDPFTLAGDPRPVTRARYDWQVYDPARRSKGGVRWHTVEGPFVLRRKGTYYQMFSGGNWQNLSYGVSYATAPSLDIEGEWEQACDGQQVLPIVRTIPGQVVGPGHNSVVRGPDNRQLYCVYHRWEKDARVLCIDRLDWAGDRLFVIGPSVGPQPAPGLPLQIEPPAGPVGGYEARIDIDAPALLCELTFEMPPRGEDGELGVLFAENGMPLWNWQVDVHGDMRVRGGSGRSGTVAPRVRPGVAHLLRVELNGRVCTASLDGAAWCWQGRLEGRADGLALVSSLPEGRVLAFEMTPGWEDRFDTGETLHDLGWHGEEEWRVAGDILLGDGLFGTTSIAKAFAFTEYELVVTARLVHEIEGGGYGIRPAIGREDQGPLLLVTRGGDGWRLVITNREAQHEVALPAGFDGTRWEQLRVRRSLGLLRVTWGGERLVEIPAPEGPTWPGLVATRALAGFDMVRLTERRTVPPAPGRGET